MKRCGHGERGSQLVEYAVVLSGLLAACLAAAVYLSDAGKSRADKSMLMSETVLPCGGGGLSGDQCK